MDILAAEDLQGDFDEIQRRVAESDDYALPG